jgi:DNA (cytosine-5)-methyltransferase 1
MHKKLINNKDNNIISNMNKSNTTKFKNLKIKKQKHKQLKFIDLFCGVGGFHQALKLLKHKCILACDIDKYCREVYKNNYKLEPVENVKNIDETKLKDFDIICGGFPCQPFSNSGKKKSFDDERGLLFDEIIRIAIHKKPRFMFLENVKHILKVSNGAVIEYIKKKIDEIGYKLQLFKMSPHEYGIPQQRERIFFVCVRKDIYNNKDIELLNINKNLTFKDILETNVDSKYKVKSDVENVFNAWEELITQFEVGEKLSPTILINDAYKNYTEEEFENLANWRKDYMTKNKRLLTKYKSIIDPWYEKHKELLNKREIYGKLEWQAGPLKENDSIFNYFITLRQSGIRVKRAKYFPTLVAISQIPIYAKEKRYLTPRECARLQSYPETLKLHETDRVSYKQMGNSVNVFNTYTVIKSTLNHYGYNQ